MLPGSGRKSQLPQCYANICLVLEFSVCSFEGTHVIPNQTCIQPFLSFLMLHLLSLEFPCLPPVLLFWLALAFRCVALALSARHVHCMHRACMLYACCMHYVCIVGFGLGTFAKKLSDEACTVFACCMHFWIWLRPLQENNKSHILA